MKLNIVILGLSITSSWGNGHATTYRALVKALAARGHSVTFLERDVAWYRQHRDMARLPYCQVELYEALRDVPLRFGELIARADLVILGSYVPDGAVLGDWITSTARGITAFYDIDTPVTLKRLESGDVDYISARLIPRFDIYLSFTGGPTLDLIENMYGSPRARALYCSADPGMHLPSESKPIWTLGYLGTYSEDRQAALDHLLLEPARRMPGHRFVVAGAQYPKDVQWPSNVELIEHLPPAAHPLFYCRQRYTLNLTRPDMAAAGFSPSVRLFEAAACGAPVISDSWPGMETFFIPGKEVLLADSTDAVLRVLKEFPERQRGLIGAAARRRTLQEHTAVQRATTLEQYYHEAIGSHSSNMEVVEAAF
jgi:spore maturation protein CgeB